MNPTINGAATSTVIKFLKIKPHVNHKKSTCLLIQQYLSKVK